MYWHHLHWVSEERTCNFKLLYERMIKYTDSILTFQLQGCLWLRPIKTLEISYSKNGFESKEKLSIFRSSKRSKAKIPAALINEINGSLALITSYSNFITKLNQGIWNNSKICTEITQCMGAGKISCFHWTNLRSLQWRCIRWSMERKS